ncbi:DUF1707 domain-containing protein [Kribbella sp. HUAS MG21]|uniref:DUF1707 domain-containing protein n=1 Tax=Kribbella sp. HUAS MG21 TaxID=3160966 RepID=A0AAU7TNC5_9ACTN
MSSPDHREDPRRHRQTWTGRGWYNDSTPQPRDERGWGWGPDWRATNRPTPADRPQDRTQDGIRDAGARKRVRIGDAERDRAVAQLSEHFVAGRLTQVEFEERSEQVTHARYSDDIDPLFDDLPTSAELQPAQPSRPVGVRRPGPPPQFLMIVPFLMIGLVVSSIALTAPWLLWGLFWIVLLSGLGRHHGHHHYRR